MKRKLFPQLSLFLFTLGFAKAALAVDVSQAVNNILGPLSAFTDSFYKICYALGIILIVGSGIQYRMHRKNPMQIRLSNVIFLLIVGIVVVCLPFLVKLSTSSRIIDNAVMRQQATVPKTPYVPSNTTPDQTQDNNWYDNPQQAS
jgi:hypothetical protein